MSKHKYEIVKFTDEDFEVSVNVSPKEETVWLSPGFCSCYAMK